MSTIRDYLNEQDDEVTLLEPSRYDEAIVGLVERACSTTVVCYDRRKIVDILMGQDGMDRDEAEEFFEFNIAGAYVGEGTPVFLSTLNELPI